MHRVRCVDCRITLRLLIGGGRTVRQQHARGVYRDPHPADGQETLSVYDSHGSLLLRCDVAVRAADPELVDVLAAWLNAHDQIVRLCAE